jgi:hypothetical protein
LLHVVSTSNSLLLDITKTRSGQTHMAYWSVLLAGQAAQAAVLQQVATDWPEVWGCSVASASAGGLSPQCEMNGRCVARTQPRGADSSSSRDNIDTAPAPPGSALGQCVCEPGWRGPTCASLKLGPTPRQSGAKPKHGDHLRSTRENYFVCNSKPMINQDRLGTT